MKRDDFLQRLTAQAGVNGQRLVLTQLLEEAFGPGAASTPGEARKAVMNNCLEARDALLELLTIDLAGRQRQPVDDPECDLHVANLEPGALSCHRIELATGGMTTCLSQLKRWRFRERHRLVRRDFREEHAGLPAFRDADHGELRMLGVRDVGSTGQSGRSRQFSDVAPFLDHHVSKKARARLYTQALEARRLSVADLRSSAESALIGQRGVFARRSIPADTCVGVMGGQLLDIVDLFIVKDDRYLISAGSSFLNGENLMSLINTTFLVDAQGRVSGHPKSGYNVERVAFQARINHGWDIELSALFTIEDILPGEELRWNYQIGRVDPGIR